MPLRRVVSAVTTALAFACVALWSTAAAAQAPRPAPRGDAVALLPLDAETRLEIYGQAVATEIARALISGGIEVVVVGAKMDVPAETRLIVDGTLASETGPIVLSMRVRNPLDGQVLDTLSATAPNLGQIDKAAADLSARVLPVVRARLTALAADRSAQARAPLPPRPSQGGGRPPLLVGIAAIGAPATEPLRAAMAGAVEGWTRAARREPRVVGAHTLAKQLAAKAVASANAERAVVFEVLEYTVTLKDEVPLARARVRVRIADAATVLFERVVATDTIVGERRMREDALAALVASEVLSILRPHMRRAVDRWP